MNGVEILSENAVYTTQIWAALVGILAFIGIIIFAIITFNSKSNVAIWINFVCCVICLITLSTVVFLNENTNYLTEYSHTEFKVAIDDSVSMNEFLDKYEILDQEGKIYTVKEKE